MTHQKPKRSYALIQSITTIHGTNRFNFLRGRPLTLWCCVMMGNVLLTAAFVIVIKQKFNENQIVTQINPNCKVNQVPFPAISICNFNMVSLRESTNIVQLLKYYNISDHEIHKFLNALPLLKSFNKQARDVAHFTDIMRILKKHFFTVDTIMEEIHQRCENLLLYCAFNRKQMKCENIFSLIKTYEGHCCTFNYAALNDASEVPMLPSDGDLEFYDDQNEASITQSGNIITTLESGSGSGLTVVLNVEPNDYPDYSHVPYYGAKIMLSDPNDYPETTISYRYIALGDSLDMKVEALIYQSEQDLRRVNPKKRGCLFYDEVVLEHTDRYSFETCNTECRMQTYLEICGCIPYKYPRDKSNRICEFEDLICLNNVTVFKSIQDMKCKPVCVQECVDKKYYMTSDLVPFLKEAFPANITQNFNVSELAAVKVYFEKSTCNCYRMTLLIDVNYFIATYGGVFGLSFGGSLLTLFELIYLIIAQVIKAIMKGLRNVIREEN